MSARTTLLIVRVSSGRRSDLALALLRCAAVALATCCATAGVAFAGTWRQVGPSAADAWAVAFDPSTPGVVYAGTSDGLYRSSDGGANWSQVGLAGLAVGRVAVHPRFPEVIYAAADDDPYYWSPQVLRSTDGGVTWVPPTNSFAAGRVFDLAVDPDDPDRAWAGGEHGLFATSDGGLTWTAAPAPFGSTKSVKRVAIDSLNPATMFAINGGAVYKSEDGGATWSLLDRVFPSQYYPVIDLAIDPINPANVYATSYGGFSRSSDGGAHWQTLYWNLPYGLTHFGTLLLAPSEPSTLLVQSMSSVYLSTDRGTSWEQLTCAGSSCSQIKFFGWQAAFDPFDSNSVLVADDVRGVLASHDSGFTSEVSDRGIHNVYTTSLLVDPGGAVWAGTFSQGVFRSGDGTRSWDQTVSYDLTGCTGPCSGVGKLVSLASPSRIAACTSFGAMTSTGDTGTWSWLGGRGSAKDIAQDPTQPDTLLMAATYMGMYDGGLFVSTDGGQTWTEPLRTAGVHSAVAVAFLPWAPGSVLAAAEVPVGTEAIPSVLLSRDHGTSWTVLGKDWYGITALLPDPTTPGLILAATGKGVVQSRDGGTTWMSASSGILDYESAYSSCPVQSLVRDPASPANLVAATACGLYLTHDNARSWEPLGSAPANTDIRALALVDGGRTLLAGTYGSGVWALDLVEKRAIRRSLSRVP